jgi:GDSL-like Lipase/Acylhydrolase
MSGAQMVKYPLLLGFFLLLSGLPSANGDNASVSPRSPSQRTINTETSGNIKPKLSKASWKSPQGVNQIFYLGDSYLDDGNYQALTGFPLEYFSNEPPWGTDVNVTLGLPAVGRWSPAGSAPNPLGNNYAVAGSSIGGDLTLVDTSLRGQVNLMLSDYPKGLPADSLVVVAIGTSDIIGAMNLGGIWSLNLSGWRLNGSGFTVPPVGSTVTVKVKDTLGLVAGSNNLVAFPNRPFLTALAVTAVDLKNSTVTLTNLYAVPGTVVSGNAKFKMAATYSFDLEIPVFTRAIEALVADGAKLVVALPQRTDFLPFYDRQSDQTLAYVTWLYIYTEMAAAIPKKAQNLYFDLSGFFDSVFFNYAAYGFSYNYPGWDDNPEVSANEYLFWDNLHPSGLMHQLIADDFIQLLQLVGLVPSTPIDGPNERHSLGSGSSK